MADEDAQNKENTPNKKTKGENNTGEINIDTEPTGPLNVEALENMFSKKSKEKKTAKNSTQNEEEYNKLKSELLYLRAEFDNYKKNAIKERADLLKYGGERSTTQFLTVIDHLEMALATEVNAENFENFFKGVELTAKEFHNSLKSLGVSTIDPLGKAFDPNFHEALSSEETDQFEPGIVSKVFRKAYVLHDKIIRPAQVVVAKEKTTTPPPIPKSSDTQNNQPKSTNNSEENEE